MPKQVTRWQTSDGETFVTEGEALLWENRAEISRAIRRWVDTNPPQQSYGINSAALASALHDWALKGLLADLLAQVDMASRPAPDMAPPEVMAA